MSMSRADILADAIKDRLGDICSEEEYLKVANWVDELYDLAELQINKPQEQKDVQA